MDNHNSRDGQSITKFLIKIPKKSDTNFENSENINTTENNVVKDAKKVQPNIQLPLDYSITIHDLEKELEEKQNQSKEKETFYRFKLEKNAAILRSTLINVAKSERENIRSKIQRDSRKLGCISNYLSNQLDSANVIWNDGDEMKEIKELQRKIKSLRSEITDKRKYKTKIKKTGRTSISSEISTPLNSVTKPTLKDEEMKLIAINEENEISFDSNNGCYSPYDDGSNLLDSYVEKEIIATKQIWIQNEEQKIKQKLIDIEIQRKIHHKELLIDDLQDRSVFSNYPIINNYQLLNLIGFHPKLSEVWNAFCTITYKHVVLKIYRIGQNMESIQLDEGLEVDIPLYHTAKILDAFQLNDNKYYVIVYPFIQGHSLETHLLKYGAISEKEAKIIIHQLLIGLQNIYQKTNWKYCGTIKAKNIIYNNGIAYITELYPTSLKIKEILAQKYPQLSTSLFGNIPIIQIVHNEYIDILSIALLFFEILFFNATNTNVNENDLTSKLVNCSSIINKFNFSSIEFPSYPKVSHECKEFIKAMLSKDAEGKITISQVLSHSYLKG